MPDNFVDPTNGSDTYDGTVAAWTSGTTGPWATIGKALGAAGMASGENCYLAPGVYREVVTVAMTSPTGETFIIGDPYAEQAWAASVTPGVVEWTAWLTSDSAISSSSSLLTFAQQDFLTFSDIRLVQGLADMINSPASGAAQSENIKFTRCEIVNNTSTNSNSTLLSLVYQGGTSGGTVNWTFDKCFFWFGMKALEWHFVADGATGYDCGVLVQDCSFVSNDGDVINFHAPAGTGEPQGGKIYGCDFIGIGHRAAVVIDPTDNDWSTGTGVDVQDCFITGGPTAGAALEAAFSGQITSDYNIILHSTPYLNVTKGTNDVSTTVTAAYRSPSGMALAAPWMLNFPVKRYPFAPMDTGCAWIGDGASANQAATDAFGNPRPGSGSAVKTPGAHELTDMSTQETTTTQAGANSLKMTGPQVSRFQLAVDAVQTTVNIYAYRVSANYTLGTRPSMGVTGGEAVGVTGVSPVVSTLDDTWEQISITFTPTAAGFVTIVFESATTATTGVCYFDTFSVS